VLYVGLNSNGWWSTIAFFAGGAMVAWHWDEDKFFFIHSKSVGNDEHTRDRRKLA